MVDPASISPQNYARIQTALVQQEMWTVLDRLSGLQAIKHEQEELHRTSIDRYDDKQKYAHWGRLYGVGAVVVGFIQCHYKSSFWNPKSESQYCEQFLNLVDANSGEVLVGVEGGDWIDDGNEAPSWKDVVQKLADGYPKNFVREPSSERRNLYLIESRERAVQQKEYFILNRQNGLSSGEAK
jgi:hypothetical protein